MSEVEMPSTSENVDIVENSTIRQMREALDNEKKGRKALEQQVADFDAKLREMEQSEKSSKSSVAPIISAGEEKQDASPSDEIKPALQEKPDPDVQRLRDEHGKFLSKFQSMYEAELESVPEAARPQIEKLSAAGDWADRLEALRAAKSLLGTSAPVQAMGGAINPAAQKSAADLKPAPNFDWKNPPPLSATLKR